MRVLTIIVVLAAVATPAAAEGPARPDGGSTAGLALRFLAPRAPYVLQDGGAALRKQLADAAQAQVAADADVTAETTTRGKLKRQLNSAGVAGRALEPQEIDLTVEVVNNAKQAIELLGEGDDRVELRLAISGPGVVILRPRNLQTMEVRMGVPFRLQPGESRRIAISRLAYGQRGDAERAYLTRPGRYTLVATLVTGRRTGPAGAMGEEDTYAPVVLTSNPITLDVDSPGARGRSSSPAPPRTAKDRPARQP